MIRNIQYCLKNYLSKNIVQKQAFKFARYGLEKENVNRFGEIPEDNLLSKSTEEIYRIQMQQNQEKLSEELNIEIENNKNALELTKKQEKYDISAHQYLNFRKQNKHGKVNILNYKGSKITLAGTQYQHLPIKNIYKLLKYSKPDIICLQVRPDQILKNFIVNIKNPDTGYFSSSRYFKQILKKGYEIMPSNEHRQRIQQDLLLNKIFLSPMSNKDEIYYEEYKQEISKNYKPYSHKERLSLDTIATACFYAERNNIPLVLCDIPEIIFRQDIVNKHTLMQLQNIFTKCARHIAREPDLEPHTPLSAAFNIFPDEFLNISDQYISTVFQYLNAKKYKNITALLGNTQSESIMEVMENRLTGHLADYLQHENVKHSLVRDITSEEIIEKHSILDTMMHGKEIIKDFRNLEFQTTYEIINRYGNPDHTDNTRLQKLRILHYQSILKYAKFAQQEYMEGERLLKREFLKKVGY